MSSPSTRPGSSTGRARRRPLGALHQHGHELEQRQGVVPDALDLVRPRAPPAPRALARLRFAWSSLRVNRSRSFCSCRHFVQVSHSRRLRLVGRRSPGMFKSPILHVSACASICLSSIFMLATSAVQSARAHGPSLEHKRAWISVLGPFESSAMLMRKYERATHTLPSHSPTPGRSS